MKKIFKIMLFVAIATLTFTSCNKENTTTKQQEDTILDFNMNYSAYDRATKATKKSWTNGDIVYMIFKQAGENGYNVQHYVKLQCDGKKWDIIQGHDVLNSLSDGEGYVSACHHSGESLLLWYRGEEHRYDDVIYINPLQFGSQKKYNYGCFSVFCNDVRYTKQNNRIEATLNFKPKHFRNQLNIKGLSIDELYIDDDYYDEVFLQIYKSDRLDLPFLGGFSSFSLSFEGVSSHGTSGGDAQPSPGDDKEISFYFSLIKDILPPNTEGYTLGHSIDINGDTTYFHTFKPTFRIFFQNNNTTARAKTMCITKEYDKEVTISEYCAYYLDGPTKTVKQIIDANVGDSLGCGWVKSWDELDAFHE